MSQPTYKTNRLLWFVLSLVIFILNFYGFEILSALFSGRMGVEDVLSFEVLAPVTFSIVAGWLLQCAIVIVRSWKRAKSKPK